MNIAVTTTSKMVDFLKARESYKASKTDYNEATMVCAYAEMIKGTSIAKTLKTLLKAGVMDNPVRKAQLIETIVNAKVLCSQSN